MKHVEIHIDEYLKGELTRAEAERIAAHLEECARCRQYRVWLEDLDGLTASARMEPPAEVVAGLKTRLAALPGRIDAEEVTVPPMPERTTPLFRTPAWLAYPGPLLKSAAVLILGVLIGYSLWGESDQPVITGSVESVTPVRSMPAAPSDTDPAIRQASLGSSHIEALEARITELERALMITWLARVEATVNHFVTGASEGMVDTTGTGSTNNLLTVAASMKSDAKAAGDTRMVNLFGQIESVLTEIGKVSIERDLDNARFIAGIIEEQGLLNTLQRIKVGLEE